MALTEERTATAKWVGKVVCPWLFLPPPAPQITVSPPQRIAPGLREREDDRRTRLAATRRTNEANSEAQNGAREKQRADIGEIDQAIRLPRLRRGYG